MKKVRVLNIGSINIDLRVALEQMPKGGETTFGDSYEYIPGGKGANQGVAAARLGGEVTFLGRCGEDAFGKQMTENFAAEGIDTSFISFDTTAPTGLAVIPVENNGQNRIIVISGANSHVNEDLLPDAFSREYDVVLTGLEVPLNTVYKAYSLAKEKNIPMVLDCGPAMEFDMSALKGIDVVSPNETECLAMTGIKPEDEASALKASEIINSKCSPKHVVLKMGGKGAFWYHNGKGKLFPAEKGVNVVDTTAAGDCFTAALAIKWMETGDMEKAICYANKAAAICISRVGAQPSLPYENEIN